ncbi:hypothetical protein [Methanosarcina vacuolata]|uniref:hypothetical protein n=1 Tax=Methanosarcina vacuolata TaxID=2215 RepID=UPI00064FFB84|nr:hypothetical protein [Methanosarcina vacuolata]
MTALSEIFGECPQVKILEAFAEDNRGMLYIADIIRVTKLSKMTVNSYIHKLLDENIIQKSEKAGKIQYYELNKNNPKAKIILSLVKHIKDQNLEGLMNKDIINDTRVSNSTGFTNDEFSNAYYDTQSSYEHGTMTINYTDYKKR